MKKLMFIIAISLGIAIILPANANAQGCCQKGSTSCNKTEQSTSQAGSNICAIKDSLKVSGKCGMCKTRIETATKSVKGVTYAFWNETSGMLTYSYNGTVKKNDISKALLKVGHDTEFGKAPDKVYNNLPACCKYR